MKGEYEMDSGFEHDATATWSGYIYQGYVAIYVALKQICRLLSSPDALDKETIGLIYQLEVENWEDVAIVREDENRKTYLSIHQVKNRQENNICAYKRALIQLMLEKGFLNQQNLGVPEAYLHTSREIKEEEKEINQLLINWKNSILEFYKKISVLARTKNDQVGPGFKEKVNEIIEQDPICLKRASYTYLLSDIVKCVKNENDLEVIIEAVKHLKEYLDKDLAISGIDEKIELYLYDGNIKSCNGNELYEKIVEQVEKYKCITKSSDNLIKEQYEYIADKLVGYMREQILSRHELMRNKKKYKKHIPFAEMIQILDEGLYDYDTKANIAALRRIYDEAVSEYCLISCDNACEGKDSYECKLFNSKDNGIDLSDEEFKKMCFSYNPNCSKKIKDRSCLNELMQKDGLEESVFEVLRNVPEQYFVEENNRTRTVLNDFGDNAFLTAIVGSKAQRVVKNIVEGINKNAELVSPVFEADKLITVHLHSNDETLWDSDYTEISEKYMSREAVESSDDSRNSVCKPKKPQFIRAQDVVEKLI